MAFDHIKVNVTSSSLHSELLANETTGKATDSGITNMSNITQLLAKGDTTKVRDTITTATTNLPAILANTAATQAMEVITSSFSNFTEILANATNAQDRTTERNGISNFTEILAVNGTVVNSPPSPCVTASSNSCDTSQGFKNASGPLSMGMVMLACTLTIVVLVTIIGNTLVLLSVAFNGRLRTAFNCYIVNLAITDVLVATTAMPMYILDTILGYWPFGEYVCSMWIFFDFALTFASVFTLVAISIDRYWSVSWSLHYRIHHSVHKCIGIILFTWLCTLLVWLAPFISDRIKWSQPHVCIWQPSQNREFVSFVAVVGHYLPCLIMVFCYAKVFIIMRRRARVFVNLADSRRGDRTSSRPGRTTAQTKSIPGTSTANDLKEAPPTLEGASVHRPNKTYSARLSNSALESSSKDVLQVPPRLKEKGAGCRSTQSSSVGASESAQETITIQVLPTTSSPQYQMHAPNQGERERKVFILLTYVVFAFLICWFPFYVVFDLMAWLPHLIPSELYTFLFWMTYLNSTVNPILYAYSNKEFRSTFIKLLRCRVGTV